MNSRFFLHFWAAFFVTVFLTGCGEEDDASKDKTAPKEEAPSKPTLAIHNDNISPNNSVKRPKFTVSGLVVADKGKVSLHKGSDCSEAAISEEVKVDETSKDVTVTSDMSEGANAIRAKVTNDAGNSSCSDAASYVYDTTAPTISSVTAVAGSYKASENIDFTVTFSEAVTANTTTGDDRSYLSIDVGTSIDQQKAYYQSGSGTTALVYRYTVASSDTDSDGVAMDANLNVGGTGSTLKDAAGNAATLTVAAETFSTVLVDTTNPTVTISADSGNDFNSATFTWVCANSEICQYRYAINTSSTHTFNTEVWGSTATVTQSTGSDTYYLHVQAQDAAGNTALATPESFTLNNTTPAAPTLALKTPTSSPGNSSTPIFTASNVADTYKVELFSDNTCSTSVSSEATATGTTVDVTANAQTANTTVNYYAKATHPTSNLTACSSSGVSYEYDSTAPTQPTIAIHNDNRSPSNSVARPKFTVSGLVVADNGAVTLHKGSDCTGTAISTSMNVSSTSHDITATSDMSQGANAIRAKATDDAGNSSCSDAVSYIYDTTSPGNPSIARHDPSTATGTDTTPTFRVTNIVSGDTITLHKVSGCTDTALATVTASATTEDLTPGTALSVGSYTFYAKAEDTASNSACSSTGAAYQVLESFGTLSWSGAYTGGSLAVGGTRAIGTAPTVNPAVSGSTWAYSSTTATKCSVNGSGTITAIDGGSCVIKATISKSGYASKSINHAAVTITNNTFTGTPTWSSYASSTVSVGSTVSLSATPSGSGVTPSDGTFSFASSDETKCTVTSAGVVTGVAVGACTITGTYAKAGYTSLTNDYSSITVSKGSQTLAAPSNPYGTSPSVAVDATLAITTAPTAGQGNIEYQTTTSTYCSVNTSGTVTGVAMGTDVCTIQARYAGNSNYNASSWTDIETGIDVTKGSQTLTWPSNPYGSDPTVGFGQTLSLSTAPTAGKKESATVGYQVKSTNSTVCSVNSTTGQVTGDAGGSCYIEAQYESTTNYNASAWVAITTPIEVLQPQGMIAAGDKHSCSVISGRMSCWGDDTEKQLGNGSTTGDKALPIVTAVSGYKNVEVGEHHSCGLTSSGGVKCWGKAGDHRLGTGLTTPDHNTPTDVKNGASTANALTGVESLSVGWAHACVVMASDGAVNCWGSDTTGQTGQANEAGSGSDYLKAVKGIGGTGTLTGIKQVSAGGFAANKSHTCAVEDDGDVVCWGSNSGGQLGANSSGTCGSNGDCQGSPLAVTLASSAKAAQVSVGGEHTCAVTTTGGVQCWGKNEKGQLGTGNTTNQTSPTAISSLSGVLQVVAGKEHTCALLSTGAIKCWGSDSKGQLGNGSSTTDDQNAPSNVSGITNAIALAAGSEHTCAMLENETLRCWGEGDNGRLGTGSTTDQADPKSVPSYLGKLTLGTDHSCAVVGDGAKCWGSNASAGRLGNNENSTIKSTPVSVSSLTGVLAIDSGYDHTCALTKTGGVKCWGSGGSYRLSGTATNSLTPRTVNLGSDKAVHVSAGGEHTCAVLSNGTVKCWGENTGGRLGNNTQTDASTPTTVTGGLTNVLQIEAGQQMTCALLENQKITCWGDNTNGALGRGYSGSHHQFGSYVSVGYNQSTNGNTSNHFTGAIKIKLAEATGCALKADGTVWCWGQGHHGMLGEGGATPKNGPTQVTNASDSSNLTDAVDLEAGRYHFCVITKTGGVKCWGAGNNGRLGHGSANTSNRATASLSNLSNVVGLGAGNLHTCALLFNEKAKCWGQQQNGRLGNGQTTSATVTTPPTTAISL